MWSKNWSGRSLDTQKIIMVEFFRPFTSPSPPCTHSFSYHKEGTHLCQWEASAGFNYLFSINWYSSGEPCNPIMNMAAIRCVWCQRAVWLQVRMNPASQVLRPLLFDHQLSWNIRMLCILLWCHYYVNKSVDHNNFIPLINNWYTQIVDKIN